ncbi:flagellar biosynthesis protein FliP [Pedobacter sp. UYEF25]
MDITDSLQKITLKEIAQTPFAWALYAITLVLVSVIFAQRQDMIQERKDHNLEIKEERKLKDDIATAYMVEHMTNQQIQKTVDSTAIKNYKKNEK